MYNTMARSKRLKPILRLAERKEINAAHTMAEARRRLHYYEEKLAELRSYRTDYGISVSKEGGSTMSVTQLREYQAFIHQLNEGIAMLAEKIEGQRQLKQRDENLWITAKKNTDVLDKLIIKLKWMERKFTVNREADEIDERSSRNFRKGEE